MFYKDYKEFKRVRKSKKRQSNERATTKVLRALIFEVSERTRSCLTVNVCRSLIFTVSQIIQYKNVISLIIPTSYLETVRYYVNVSNVTNLPFRYRAEGHNDELGKHRFSYSE